MPAQICFSQFVSQPNHKPKPRLKAPFRSLCLTVVALWVLFVFFSGNAAFGFGGPTKVLESMEKMVERLQASEELTEEETRQWQRAIEYLRGRVQQKLSDNQRQGMNGLNPQRDKDLYDELDRFNRPLYRLYQQSKAKNTEPRIEYEPTGGTWQKPTE
ncbi:MAG: hypothetical protein SFZ03_01825 [Candidatus Melainabacteria bacterium]|nr:hypothetical protein [Candidatus Melainabacteria bacterium]